jgi:hypothetical protein
MSEFDKRVFLNMSGGNPVKPEFDAAMDLYTDYGFVQPKDITIAAFICGVGGAFITEELPPAQHLPDIGPTTKRYFGNEVQPTLIEDARRGEAKALDLAHQVGRLISAAHISGMMQTEKPLPFDMVSGTVLVDGRQVEYEPAAQTVVDYGMGMVGLITHLKNVKSNQYALTGIQKTRGEAKALQGMVDHHKQSDVVGVLSGGITKNAAMLIGNNGEGIIDVVVASRVHSAGDDLENGIKLGSQLLHKGGLLVARGPRRYDHGTDYDRIHDIIKRDPKLAIEVNHAYTRTSHSRSVEPNRAIVARKK